MSIPGARFRVKTTESGKKIRLAFVKGRAVEAKNLQTGETRTMEETHVDEHPKHGKSLRHAFVNITHHP